MVSIGVTTTLPLLAGVLSHVLYFRTGEHHRSSAKYAQAVVVAPAVGTFTLAALLAIPYFPAFLLSLQLETFYLSGLYASLLVYRAFFHRLHSFPGPLSWRLTKLTQAWTNLDLMNYKHLDALFRQYGEYVRTGPRELMIIDPDACASFISRCARGVWYDVSDYERSLLGTIDRAKHDMRRRVWDKAFGARALRDYEPRVSKHVAELSAQMGKRTSQPVDWTEWINFFSFDVMGDLAFAKSFDILPTGKKPAPLQLLEEGQKPLGVLGTSPWLFQVLLTLPFVTAGHFRFVNYCSKLMDERIKMDKGHDDIASWLIDGLYSEDGSKGSKEKQAEELKWLHGDSRLVVVAGSDTTAATLSYCMYYLCKQPAHAARIRSELARLESRAIDEPASTGETVQGYDARDLQNRCDYLNGFISEALRMHPPVPGGFMRVTPTEGMWVHPQPDAAAPDAKPSGQPAWLDGADAKPADGVFVPADVNVWMPIYTLGRNPRCWTAPDSFAPARWVATADARQAISPELAPHEAEPQVLRKDAFLPFSAGAMGCIGRHLALQEIRLVIAAVVDRFDVKFAPGEDGRGLIEDTRDWFTLGLAPLQVVFEERKREL